MLLRALPTATVIIVNMATTRLHIVKQNNVEGKWLEIKAFSLARTFSKL
jgi:hypothetical protein